eukprot:361200-Chlamydomonas_euryale.AAC.29
MELPVWGHGHRQCGMGIRRVVTAMGTLACGVRDSARHCIHCMGTPTWWVHRVGALDPLHEDPDMGGCTGWGIRSTA